MIEIEKELVGDFLVLTVKAPGVPDKKISVLAESLVDGTTTLDEQMEIARKDAERRMDVLSQVSRMIQ